MALMAQTNGAGKNAKLWMESLTANVPSWDQVSFATCLDNFCQEGARSRSTDFQAGVRALAIDGSDRFMDKETPVKPKT